MRVAKLHQFFLDIENEGLTGSLQVTDLQTGHAGIFYFLNGYLTLGSFDPYDNHMAAIWALGLNDTQIDWKENDKPPKNYCTLRTFLILEEYNRIDECIHDDYPLSNYMEHWNRLRKTRARRPFQYPGTDDFCFYLEGPPTTTVERVNLFDGSYILGSSENADITVPDSSISREHCEIKISDQSIRIFDLGSTNGTYIDNHLIDQDTLLPGDSLQVGHIQLRMKLALTTRPVPSALSPQSPQTPEFAPSSAPSQKIPLATLNRPVAKAEAGKPLHWNSLENTSKISSSPKFPFLKKLAGLKK